MKGDRESGKDTNARKPLQFVKGVEVLENRIAPAHGSPMGGLPPGK